MPYIGPEAKIKLAADLDAGLGPETAGELVFILTQLCTAYIHRHGHGFAILNNVIGALECTKLEFYRRVAAPYEDRKCAENGDVYLKEAL